MAGSVNWSNVRAVGASLNECIFQTWSCIHSSQEATLAEAIVISFTCTQSMHDTACEQSPYLHGTTSRICAHGRTHFDWYQWSQLYMQCAKHQLVAIFMASVEVGDESSSHAPQSLTVNRPTVTANVFEFRNGIV